MFNATYPEYFYTINNSFLNVGWVVVSGCLFLLIVGALVLFGRTKCLERFCGVEAWLIIAFIIWLAGFGLGDTIAWTKQVFKNLDMFDEPTAVRQGERLCEIWKVQYAIDYCAYRDFYDKIAQIPKGSSVYWFPTPHASDLYLRYWFATGYKLVDNYRLADYSILIYPKEPHVFKEGHLLDKMPDGQLRDLGIFDPVTNIGPTSIFRFKR